MDNKSKLNKKINKHCHHCPMCNQRLLFLYENTLNRFFADINKTQLLQVHVEKFTNAYPKIAFGYSVLENQ